MKTLSKLLLLSSLLFGCSMPRLPQNTEEHARTSVMITNEAKTSGGSGVVIKSTADSSLVLTNKHVCQLIQVGGLVSNEEKSVPVASFRVYTKHDLCLIEVKANLHQNNRLAEKEPKIYSEVTIAGHPALLPTMVTRGHFANKMTITIMVDTQACDGKEKDEEAFMCALTGAKPVLVSLEAQPVTATIMPGSSGSGVFNDRGEVAGLVFAGSQGLSYGFIVPHSYLKDFLSHVDKYPAQLPDKDAKPKSFFTTIKKLREICYSNPRICKQFIFPGIYQ